MDPTLGQPACVSAIAAAAVVWKMEEYLESGAYPPGSLFTCAHAILIMILLYCCMNQFMLYYY